MAASAARYPTEECHLILQECTDSSIPLEGGRYTPSDSDTVETVLEALREKAFEEVPHRHAWDQVVKPWLEQRGVKLKTIKIMKVDETSAEKSIDINQKTGDRAAPVDAVEEWFNLFNRPSVDPEEGNEAQPPDLSEGLPTEDTPI